MVLVQSPLIELRVRVSPESGEILRYFWACRGAVMIENVLPQIRRYDPPRIAHEFMQKRGIRLVRQRISAAPSPFPGI